MAEEKAPKAATAGTEKKTASGGSDDTKLIGALCYLPIFFINVLVPLYILLTEKKNSRFLAFHAWQSLLISAICLVVFGGMFAFTLVLTVVSGGLGALLNCIILPLALLVVLGMLYIAYRAYKGEMYKLPVLGEFAEKQATK